MRGSEEGDGAAAGVGSSTRPREGAAARAYPWGKGRRSPARLGGGIRGTGETTGAFSAVPVTPSSQQTPSTCAGAIPTPGLHHHYRGCPADTDLGHWVQSAVARLAGLPPRSAIPGVPWWCTVPEMGLLLFSRTQCHCHRCHPSHQIENVVDSRDHCSGRTNIARVEENSLHCPSNNTVGDAVFNTILCIGGLASIAGAEKQDLQLQMALSCGRSDWSLGPDTQSIPVSEPFRPLSSADRKQRSAN
ncbi:unnamed protein product [Urochloa humidicola]